jgi:hypothetical protein
MIDTLLNAVCFPIHALASYERVHKRKEQEEEKGETRLNDSQSFRELGMALSPELKKVLELRMPDGRAVVDHILEAQKLHRDLDNIGKAS